MSGEAKLLPVYLIHYNRPDWCASSVASLSRSQGQKAALTVIDNGSVDGSSLTSLLPPGTRVLSASRNLGYAAGANRAIDDWRTQPAGAEYCVIGSHDLHVEPDTLHCLVEAADSHPEFGILGPVLVRPFETSGGVWERGVARRLPLVAGDGVVERDWVSGTCLLLRAACVEQVGLFDARFGSYVEDVDFCLRAGDAGWKVGSVGGARAWGLGSASELAAALTEANSIRLMFKRLGWPAGALASAQLAGWVARSALGSLSPWREASRREISRRFLGQHLTALRSLLVGSGRG